MTVANQVNRAIALFWGLLTAIVTTAFALMLTIMAIQVISRYALGIPVSWTDEAARYLFLSQIFLGSVLALRYQEHIRITVVTDLMGPRVRNIVASLADIICIVVLLMLAIGGWNMMERTSGILASTFRLSFSYIYLIQLISAWMVIGLLIGDLYRRIFIKLPAIQNDWSE